MCLSGANLRQCTPWVTGYLKTAGSWCSGCWEMLGKLLGTAGNWLGTGWGTAVVGPLRAGWELREPAAPRVGTALEPRAEHLGTF